MKRLHLAHLVPLCALAAFTAAAQTTTNEAQATSAPAAAPAPRLITLDSKAVAAKRIDHTEPDYPIEARRAHIDGSVLLEVTISTAGIPTNIRMVAGSNILLNRAAVDAVRQFRYSPTTVDGEPVEVEATVCVLFMLGQGETDRLVPIPPVAPNIKVDGKWIQLQRNAVAALDPATVASIRHLLDLGSRDNDTLKQRVADFLARSKILITGYFPNQKDPSEVADRVISKVSAETDISTLSDLMVLAYAKHLSREQAESAITALQTSGAKVSLEQQDAIHADALAALHDFYSKVLVPEIDAEIRRINKN